MCYVSYTLRPMVYGAMRMGALDRFAIVHNAINVINILIFLSAASFHGRHKIYFSIFTFIIIMLLMKTSLCHYRDAIGNFVCDLYEMLSNALLLKATRKYFFLSKCCVEYGLCMGRLMIGVVTFLEFVCVKY